MTKERANRMKKILIKCAKISGAAALSAALLIFPQKAAQSVSDSISVCIGTIIPAMFAFMAISTYIINEGLHSVIFKPLYFVLSRVIRLDKDSFSIFCLSLIGGYPVGIKLLREAVENAFISRKNAENNACFCYCISPSFAVTMIGLGIFSSAEAGMLVYLSNAAACILMAVLFGKRNNAPQITRSRSAGGIIGAVRSSAASLFTVCTVIVAFNVILCAITETLGVFGITLPTFILGSAEISNLLRLPPDVQLLPLISGICSFGGVCVLAQCLALCSNVFSLKRFLLMRTPTAILSGIICFIIMHFAEISAPASSGSVYAFTFDSNGIVLIALMAMNIILFSKNEKNLQKG